MLAAADPNLSYTRGRFAALVRESYHKADIFEVLTATARVYMFGIWIAVLNYLSGLEFKISERLSDHIATGFHLVIFWCLPIALLYLPGMIFNIAGQLIAAFYVFMLVGDQFLSVFGHEKLEHKRGMIDITSVHEMRIEITGAVVKYIGGIVSFATLFNGAQRVSGGSAFAISNPSSLPYIDLLYFSVVTITTVGYGDISPRSVSAKVLTMAEVLFGFGFVMLLFTMLIAVYIDIQRRRK